MTSFLFDLCSVKHCFFEDFISQWLFCSLKQGVCCLPLSKQDGKRRVEIMTCDAIILPVTPEMRPKLFVAN